MQWKDRDEHEKREKIELQDEYRRCRSERRYPLLPAFALCYFTCPQDLVSTVMAFVIKGKPSLDFFWLAKTGTNIRSFVKAKVNFGKRGRKGRVLLGKWEKPVIKFPEKLDREYKSGRSSQRNNYFLLPELNALSF